MSSVREAILAADDRNLKAIDVPEWGGAKVYTRTMSGHGRAKVEKAFEDHKGNGPRIMCAIVAAGLVDEKGAPVFTDGDAEALMGKSLAVVERLYEAVMKHNHADTASIVRAEGNSDAPPSASSS